MKYLGFLSMLVGLGLFVGCEPAAAPKPAGDKAAETAPADAGAPAATGDAATEGADAAAEGSKEAEPAADAAEPAPAEEK